MMETAMAMGIFHLIVWKKTMIIMRLVIVMEPVTANP
jgi:hypothetical protein